MEDSHKSGPCRRQVLAGAISLTAVSNAAFSQTRRPENFIVGCWARAPERLAATPLSRSPRTGEWEFGTPYEHVRNVFHGYRKPNSRKFYLALDSKEDAIVRGSADNNGRMVVEGRWGSGGGEPSFIDGDRTGRYLAVANFESSVSIFRDGAFPELVATRTTTVTTPGPLPRQDRPHFHSAKFSPNNRFIYACDMGGDQVLSYSFDAATGAVGEQILAYKMPPGSGPRHTQFHANGQYCYIMNELNGTLGTFHLNADGTLSLIKMQPTNPDPNYKGYNHGGHIDTDPTGKYLYISNRGQNSLGVFAIGPEAQLTNLQWIQSGGDWPWHFLLSGSDMIVANWQSNNVTFFKINRDGTLAATGKSLPVKGPAYIIKEPA